MQNKIIALFALLFCQLALAGNMKCIDQGKITIPNGVSSARIERASYCYKKKPLQVMSKNCYNGSCRALADEGFGKEMGPNAFGTPGSHLCSADDGRAQIVFFEIEGRHIKLNRCLFFEDQSFVDLGTFWFRMKVQH